MLIKITQCSDKEWWHLMYIGKEFEVGHWSYDAYFATDAEEFGAVVPMKDCEVIKNENI